MQGWEYLLLWGSAVLGGILALGVRSGKPHLVQLLLSFSGAYLLGIAIVHLLPEIFAKDLSYAGAWVLAGFVIQQLIEPISHGIEHGHMHQMHRSAVLPIMIGLSLHAFLEGLPLEGYAEMAHEGHRHYTGINHLLLGIVLHKAPAAFALVSLLRASGLPTWVNTLCLVIFASTSPFAAWMAGQYMLQPATLYPLMAVVTGSFLHLSTTILFESGARGTHIISWGKSAAILLGFGFSVLTAM